MADTTELTRQLPLLAGCRVASKCHSHLHLQESILFCKNCQMLISEINKVALKGRGFQPIKTG
jgi:hypothetical protein